MSRCSFCNKSLTVDGPGGSVDVGYGPACALHYGLPHKALSGRKLTTHVPLVVKVVDDAPIEYRETLKRVYAKTGVDVTIESESITPAPAAPVVPVAPVVLPPLYSGRFKVIR